jgi:hypothetical protein
MFESYADQKDYLSLAEKLSAGNDVLYVGGYVGDIALISISQAKLPALN